MGNRATNASAPQSVRRSASPRFQRQSSAYVPRKPQVDSPEVEEPPRRPHRATRATVESPSRGRKSSPSGRTALPRDPTTGRYLTRAQRGIARTAPRTSHTAKATQRRVEVEVIRSPVRRQSPARKTQPRSVKFVDKTRRAASPAAVEIEQPVETTGRGSPIMRSNWSRDVFTAEAPAKPAPRGRSASPAKTRVANVAAPPEVEAPVVMSRRDYATPSLANHKYAAVEMEDDRGGNQVVMGPSTTRRMRKMAVEQTAAPQSSISRLGQSSAASPTDLLFSYLNAA